MKDDIEDLIGKGKVEQYVKKDEECQHSRSTRKGKATVNEVREPLKKIAATQNQKRTT